MSEPLAQLDPAALSRRLLALTLSAFVVLAAEPSYLLVDTAVVGHLGDRQLAGLAIAAATVSLLMIAGNFVEYGTTGRAARAYGAGDLAGARREGVQASWLALVVGLLLLVAGEVAAVPLAGVLAGHDDAVRGQAVAWLRIGLVGLPGVLLVLAGNGWLRGVQDTRTPVRVVLLANAVSAALCPVLVYPLGLGLRGSAIANLVGQGLAAVLFLRALRGPRRPVWAVMRRQLRVGRDLVVRNIGFEAAFLTAAAVTARMGTPQLAAHQIGMQLDTFTALLLDSVAIAAQSLVGAALGAADVARARHLAWQVMRWGGYAGIVFAAIFAAGYSVVPRAFTSSAATIHQAHVMWPWFVVALVPAGALFALDGVLMGAGDVGYMAGLTLVAGLVFFAPIDLAALHFGWGLGGVWAGLLAFYVVRLVGMVARTRSSHWTVVGTAT